MFQEEQEAQRRRIQKKRIAKLKKDLADGTYANGRIDEEEDDLEPSLQR